jgi:SAM-dependent methyltransferase
MVDQSTTEQRSLAHWAEAGRAGMEAFYALAVEDYRRMVAARDWAADLRGHAVEGRVRVLDVACGSGKFPAELMRRGLAAGVDGTSRASCSAAPSTTPSTWPAWRPRARARSASPAAAPPRATA